MLNFNKVILLGNLTKDPELRYNPSGKAVATLSIAVNRPTRSGEDAKDTVSFFDVVVWEKQAELCGQYLNKGSGILVEGRLQQRRWESDGQKRSKVEIVASNVQFMPKRQGQGGGSDAPDEMIDEGDIPF